MAGSQDSIYTHTQVDMHDDSSMRRRPRADADEVRRVTRFEAARAHWRAGHLLAGVGVKEGGSWATRGEAGLDRLPIRRRRRVARRVSRPDDSGA